MAETCVRMRGLPWSATETDIRGFLTDCADSIVSVHFTYNREGRPSGECYIEFNKPEAVETALRHDNEHLANRYVEVFKSKKSEMEWVLKRSGVSARNQVGEDFVVRLRGLPWQTAKEDITQFFQGQSVVQDGILIPADLNGRATGEAFVQFENKESAEKAMEKHMQNMGRRYVEVFRSSQDEVRRTMYDLQNPMSSAGAGYGGGGMYDGYGDMGGGGRGMRSGGGGMGRGAARHNPYERSKMGMAPPYGGGGGSFGAGRMGPSGAMGGYASMGRMMAGGGGYDAMPRGYGAIPLAKAGGMMPLGGASESPYDTLGVISGGKQGHFVHMRGLPFRAGEVDIVTFFSPLQVAQVYMQMDGQNRASGEADVEFYSHNDAVEAMKKDKQRIENRYIELFLNSTAKISDSNGSAPAGPAGTVGFGMYTAGDPRDFSMDAYY